MFRCRQFFTRETDAQGTPEEQPSTSAGQSYHIRDSRAGGNSVRQKRSRRRRLMETAAVKNPPRNFAAISAPRFVVTVSAPARSTRIRHLRLPPGPRHPSTAPRSYFKSRTTPTATPTAPPTAAPVPAVLPTPIAAVAPHIASFVRTIRATDSSIRSSAISPSSTALRRRW